MVLVKNLNFLFVLLDTREGLISQLTTIVHTDIATTILNPPKSLGVKSQGTDLEPILDSSELIAKHIQCADDIIDTVKETVKKQDELIIVILRANDDFTKSKITDPISIERDRVVRTFFIYFVCYLASCGQILFIFC